MSETPLAQVDPVGVPLLDKATTLLPAVYRFVAILAFVVMVWQLLGWSRWRKTAIGKLGRMQATAAANGGFATRGQIWRYAGWWWIHKRKAKAIRPSFDWWRRWTAPMREYSVRLVHVGLLCYVYASLEQVTIRISPPRGGKTGELCCHIADAPGAVVITSTKIDIVVKTIDARMKIGPVAIFNPEGMGGERFKSTFRWNPLVGCEHPMIAHRRAAALMGGAPSSEGIGELSFWTSQGVRALSQFLHAAALGGCTMLDVLSWASDPQRHADTIRELLSTSRGGEAWMHDFAHFSERTAGNTQSSITTTVMPSLEWLKDPAMQEVVNVSTEDTFAVWEFLQMKGALYLLSEGDGVSVAPLFAALVDYLWHECKKIGSGMGDEGRLDPPCSFILDEAANICPVPLQRWTSDGGGRGMPLHLSFQSRSQLYGKWGQRGGETIWGNAGAVIIYGGIMNEKDLDAFSTLCGQKDEEYEAGTNKDGSPRMDFRKVPILSPDAIRLLPEFTALVIRAGLPPVVGTVPMVWARRDVRKARRQADKAAKAANSSPRNKSKNRTVGTADPDEPTTYEVPRQYRGADDEAVNRDNA